MPLELSPARAPERWFGSLFRTRAVRRLRNDSLAGLSAITLIIIILASIFAPYLTPYPEQGAGTPNVIARLEPPSIQHPLGTDQLGRDVLARLLYGGRVSLFAAFSVVLSALLVGTTLGAVAGYVGGWLDEVIMRLTDMFLAFPPVLLAITIASVLEPNLPNTIAAVALTWWPWYTRIARGQTLSLKQREFVQSSRALGASSVRILSRHIVPNLSTPLIVQAAVDMGTAIMTIAGLSFLGIGVQPPTADWGVMVNEGRLFVQSGVWWLATFAGLMIFLTALAFNLLGDYIGIALNPKAT